MSDKHKDIEHWSRIATEWMTWRVPQIMMHFGRTEVRCLHSSGKALAMLSMWDVARGESRAF